MPVSLTGFPAHFDAVFGEIERDLADLEDFALAVLLVVAPEDRVHARDQLLGLERLGEIIVGPGGKPGQDVPALLRLGDHDERDRPAALVFAQDPADFLAVDAGQRQIEEQHVRLPGPDHLERLLAGVGQRRLEAPLVAGAHEELGVGLRIFDDENFIFHKMPSCPQCRYVGDPWVARQLTAGDDGRGLLFSAIDRISRAFFFVLFGEMLHFRADLATFPERCRSAGAGWSRRRWPSTRAETARPGPGGPWFPHSPRARSSGV